jgi:hypothetical protein
VCCFPCTDDTKTVVITATTTRGIHSIHIWRIEYQQAGRYETLKSTELVATMAGAHPNAITSISAVPAGASPSHGAAFVTCSKGSGTTTNDNYGIIRLWTKEGNAVKMKRLNGESEVIELHCEASVTKVIVAVHEETNTFIAAHYTDEHTGIELWNITLGT